MIKEDFSLREEAHHQIQALGVCYFFDTWGNMNIPTDLAGVQSLVKHAIQESIHLDYKDSRALTKANRDEIAKDVSAFANSDGGIIVYGVQEDGNTPIAIDDGVPSRDISKEWIDQIISAHISPKIPGITIHAIPKGNDRFIYVVEIPKSISGPHQASNNKYYKRYNFRSAPMEHYEVLDVLNRKMVLPPSLVVDAVVRHNHFYISIRNIGNFPATDIHFEFPDEFKWPNRRSMPSAFSSGMRFLGPGREVTCLYGASWDIIADDKHQVFEVDASYSRQHPSQFVREKFLINFGDYTGMDASKEPLYEELDRIRKAIEGLKK